MGQVLHKCATTTHAVRKAIQRSQASVSDLAEQYGVNQKTVRKWRARKSVEDSPMGPKNARSTVLTAEEEAACVAFRKHTLLPLDDCLYALQDSIPHLTHSSLHRLFQRHNISRLPDVKAEPKKKFKAYPIGCFHIDTAEVRTEDGKLYMFVAIDRTSQFVFVERYEKAGKMNAAKFLRDLIEACPYKIHTILTDNGIQFTERKGNLRAHIFDRICLENEIEHRLTKVNHPWSYEDQQKVRWTFCPSGGQVERMNRTLKEATVKRYHYSSHDQLREHLQTFVDA